MAARTALKTLSPANYARPALRTVCAASPLRAQLLARGVATKRFTEAHEWVSFDPDLPKQPATIGITDYAQNSLGDIVFVELPIRETEVERGDQIGAVESVKAASDIFAPVSGIIQDINETLDTKPTLVNMSPEDAGWLCKLKLTKPDVDFHPLMDSYEYAKFCEGEEQ